MTLRSAPYLVVDQGKFDHPVSVDCLWPQHNIGSTNIYNVCDGTSQPVPWGGMDWAAAFVVGFSILLLLHLGLKLRGRLS